MFNDFFGDFDRHQKKFVRSFASLAVVVVLLNLAFWSGLVAVILYFLNHYGVI